MLAPIVVFVYNRPEHARKTLEALARNHFADKSDLFIFSDGAKENATIEQISKIKETREIINNVSGFKSVVIEEAKTNKGLANSIIYGVTKIINQYGKVIVVEDDLITCPYFLELLNDELEAYEKDDRIFMVGGYNYNIRIPKSYHKDVYIVHRGNSTGWGCWKNRWDLADWEIKDYSQFINNPKKQSKFNRGGNDMTPMLRLQMKGEIDSWAIRWDYTMSKYNGYCVYPIKSFLWNCGFDGTGIHSGTMDIDDYIAPLYESDSYNIKLPKRLSKNQIIEFSFKCFQDGYRTSIIKSFLLKLKHSIINAISVH